MRRLIATLGTATVLLTGCGVPSIGGSSGEKKSSSPSASDSPSGGFSGTPSANPSPRPSTTPSPATTGGRLDVVLADEPPTKATCRPDRPAGVLCFQGRTLRFQPGTVRTLTVASARALELPQAPGAWGVQVVFDRPGAKAIATLTKQAMQADQELVLVRPGRKKVLTAARVASPITGGEVEISGDLTQARAARIVSLVTR